VAEVLTREGGTKCSPREISHMAWVLQKRSAEAQPSSAKVLMDGTEQEPRRELEIFEENPKQI